MRSRLHPYYAGNGSKSARQISGRKYHTVQAFLQLTISLFLISISFFSYVAAFDPKADKYVLFKKWGSEGSGNGEFERIHDLDFDPTERHLYVVDRDGNRIQVFDKNGTFVTKWGSEGSGNGEFRVPYSVDVDSNGDVSR
jgi:hypothetical protein